MRLIWVALFLGLVLAQRRADTPVAVETQVLADGLGRLTIYTNLLPNHVNGSIEYPIEPPMGGIHAPVWMNCGVYSQPINTPMAVHSLEHGALWITYRPDLSPEQIGQLKAITKADGYRLLSPYPRQKFPVVLSAWGIQLTLERYDLQSIQDFADEFTNNPEFTPEPGAPCDGGVGSPE